jgi:hypothetical protein
LGYNTHIHGNVTRKLPGAILNKQKCLFTKTKDRKIKWILFRGLIPVGRGRIEGRGEGE